jgi:malate synthase
MIINALNSGANVFMADFEDSIRRPGATIIEGQINLRDAVRGDRLSPAPKARIRAGEKTAVLMVRPRGWHLVRSIPGGRRADVGSLFDFGLFFFHNAKALMAKGTGPYFYLPKMESHLEARLWNDVFVFAQDHLGMPRGTIRATVLIETILGCVRDGRDPLRAARPLGGLNCGRWDYIFSFIKKFRNRPDFVLPNRAQVTMDRHFLSSYVDLLIQTCHRRGIHAMGGMAAQIPIKNDPAANEQRWRKCGRTSCAK